MWRPRSSGSGRVQLGRSATIICRRCSSQRSAAAGGEPRRRTGDLNAPCDLELVAREWHGAYRYAGGERLWVTPIPPCVIAHTARSGIVAWGTNGGTPALGGASKLRGSPDGSVAMTSTCSSASAAGAQRTSRPSSWNSEEVVTSTICPGPGLYRPGLGPSGVLQHRLQQLDQRSSVWRRLSPQSGRNSSRYTRHRPPPAARGDDRVRPRCGTRARGQTPARTIDGAGSGRGPRSREAREHAPPLKAALKRARRLLVMIDQHAHRTAHRQTAPSSRYSRTRSASRAPAAVKAPSLPEW